MSDSKIIQSITRRLASCGIRAPSRVAIACAGGEVTLTGTLQHEHQRHPVMRAARGAEGVRNVIDRLTKVASTGRC